MEDNENRRKKDKYDDEYRREKRPRRDRSRSHSPAKERGNQRDRERDSRRKRRHSKSRSPDVSFKERKRRNAAPNGDEVKTTVPERKAKDNDMLNTRTGGAYIPPARLRMMQAQITDKSSAAYQRLAWEALKKSIHGHINKINVGNIGIIIKELLKENIVRGRGLLCRSVIQAQAASPTFTNVYAALVAAVNSRFPNIGELLLKRLVIQFKRGFKRNDKAICISSASFIAHFVNQRVAHEILALELLTLLVETPTDDSVEVAIAFLKECGQKLTEVSSKGVNAIFEMLRNILHEGQLDKRVQYMIEVMFQVWKDGFKDHPALIEELELVPEEEQFTHLLMLDDATDPQDILNVFKFDEKYEENEQKYKTLSKDILGSDAESEDEDGSGESGSEESAEEEDEEKKDMTIIDNTETNLVALRRTIYLTINSSLDFEECAHKLMKMQLKPGQEVELCHMFLDCCAEQRTYEKFYGLLAQRFCNINRIYIGPFEEIFKDSYSTAHRLDTNRLRNVSKFFAHLLFTDSISWEVMECVRLNEEDTTSSSRIYIKILFQELAEYMGLKKLNERLKDPTLQLAFSGVFPRDNPKNTRFSINFFTSIGLGGLTDELREHLKQMPKNVPAPITEIKLDSSSDSSSSSSSSSDDSSSSDSSSSESSDEDNGNKEGKNKKTKEKKKQKPTEPVNETVEKTKESSPERWGHDGFYDTYGPGAHRTNSRPQRSNRETNASEKVSRRDYREDDRNRYDNSSRDRRTDNRRDGREKGEYRSNRHQNADSRRNEHEEHRRRDRDYESDRRRQYNDNNHRNGDDRRRHDNKEINNSDRDNDKTRRRRSSYEDKRQDYENDNDRRRHRENEENRRNVDPKKNMHIDKEKERNERYSKNEEDIESKRREKNKENNISNDSKNDKRSTTETTSRKEDIHIDVRSKGNEKKTEKQNDDVNEKENRSTRKKEISVNDKDNKKKKKKQPVSSSSSSSDSSSDSSTDSSSSGSSSESSSSEEESIRKSKKNKSKVNKENDKAQHNVGKKNKNHEKNTERSDEGSGESDDEEEQKEKKKLGGRYWEHFNISGGAKGKLQKHEKTSKRCER